MTKPRTPRTKVSSADDVAEYLRKAAPFSESLVVDSNWMNWTFDVVELVDAFGVHAVRLALAELVVHVAEHKAGIYETDE